MKSFTIILFCISIGTNAIGQIDPLADFQSHKFPCDTGWTTMEINICFGIKFEYADSLLNMVYNKIIKELDSEIKYANNVLQAEQLKKPVSKEIKEQIESYLKDLSYVQRLKESIIKSQRKWLELRDLNWAVISIGCEGGKAFVAIENQSLIDDTLERIKKLQKFY